MTRAMKAVCGASLQELQVGKLLAFSALDRCELYPEDVKMLSRMLDAEGSLRVLILSLTRPCESSL